MRTAVIIFVRVTSTKCRPQGRQVNVRTEGRRSVGGAFALTRVVGMTKSWEMKSLRDWIKQTVSEVSEQNRISDDPRSFLK